jgi:PAS domain S-box-containing protein
MAGTTVIDALLRISPGPVAITDRRGRVRAANEPFARLCGLVAGALEGVRLGDCLRHAYPGVESGCEALVARVLAEGEVTDERIEVGSGGEMRVLVAGGATFGGGEWILSTWRDATPGRESGDGSESGLPTLDRFMDMSPVGLGFIEGRVLVRVNRALRQLLGYEPGEGEGRDTAWLYPDREEYERAGREFYGAIRGGGMGTVETRLMHKDGSPVDVLIQGYAVDPSDPEGMVILGVMDISERKRAEQEHKRLQEAIEQAAEMIIVTDKDGVVQYANPAFERLSGYESEAARGRGSRPVIEEIIEDVEFEQMARTVTGGEVWQDRCLLKRADGRLLDIEATVSPVHDENGTLVSFVSVSRDITRELELEAQLRQSQKMEAIGTLAGGIAHDFNNLLHAIQGFSELSLRQVPPDGKVHAHLSEVLTASRRARDLVDQLLTFARRTEQERKRLDLSTIVKEALKLLRGSLPATIDIHARVDEQCGPVDADPTQIHQVVMNLCTNAFNAMRESGGTLEIRLAETHRAPLERPGMTHLSEGRYALLSVRDTGHGMERRTMERIFDPYFSAWSSGEGTGLGLAMVHGIVRNHGGWVNVESVPGKGTVFEVYLPVAGDGGIEGAARRRRRKVGRLGGRVMIVDDEPANLRLGREVLERLGCEVVALGDGVEALAAFRSDPGGFDAVFTDQTMPRMTGEELSRRMLETRSDLPIALATGFSDTLTEEQARAAGVREFLAKPLSVSDLEDVATKLLGGGGREDLRR